MEFKQWIEDCGQVFNQLNGKDYADKGIESKISMNDFKKLPVSKAPQKLFGVKK